ncbi:uncharacterized protein PHALS_04366 [Plasmopara halstedii]|uniref:Uncharacterized protein n=1 Tax=Plasmopara halstedii TaxID=4781 RepID=A0A0P1B0L3_PLAHL|nr:uncharacterized protein PHALS_04366 [Plasmopara halstedii]CEG47495.1 hypothetical protein PHALS_04366 [Plasmopara halstedii]|eukprot:XP_024583864.1 hypothetical protein PHALS_04366 [Plasmopara halstedii]
MVDGEWKEFKPSYPIEVDVLAFDNDLSLQDRGFIKSEFQAKVKLFNFSLRRG